MNWSEIWEDVVLIGLFIIVSTIVSAIRKSKGKEMDSPHFFFILFILSIIWFIYYISNNE